MASNLSLLKALLRITVRRAVKVRRNVALAALEESAATALGVAAPMLLKHLIDIIADRRAPVLTIAIDSLAFTAAWTGSSFLSTARLVHTGQIVEKVARHMTEAVLQAQLPRLALGQVDTGVEVASTLERLPFSLQLLIDGLLWRTPPLLIQIVARVAIVATLAPLRYAVVLAATIATYLLIVWRSADQLGLHAASMNAASLQAASASNELLKNASRAVFNGAAAVEIERYGRLAEIRRGRSLQVSQWMQSASAQQAVVVVLGLGLLLSLGGVDTNGGRLSLGVFVLLQTFAVRITAPLNGMALTLRQSAPALSNLKDVLRLAAYDPDRMLGLKFRDVPPGVCIEGVGFEYPDGRIALRSISADLPPGALIAVVGSNGSGKSTLARVLGGHLVPQAGRVWIHGVDLFSLAPPDRCQLALYIPQAVTLFNRSLRENGLYPPSQHNEEILVQALEAAAFQTGDDPLDLQRSVGEQGARLSGGQVQKLELARLLGVRVPVVILDESTSALDPFSAAACVESLRRVQPRTTFILITHERRLAASADQVLYLEDGQVCGLNPHELLLGTEPRYRRFWESSDAPA